MSYFPQNHSELVSKEDARTGFDWLRDRKQGLYDQDLRSALGKMLFGEMMPLKMWPPFRVVKLRG